ncbi:MAG: ABC transporter ATP-binding protein [Anaerolineales bacterium]
MTALLELQDVSKIYGGGLLRKETTVALEDNYIAIGREESTILAVAGESGSGKTTMGMLLLGFIEPTRGRVLYKGQDLWEAPKDVWRDFRRRVQAVFQDPFEVYNPFYKVDHVLDMPIKKFNLASSRAERAEMVEEALTGVGLRPGETLGRHPHQLSGGQRQRITVARALLLNPDILIADEPVSMIDASLRATILKSLRRLKDEMGISILYITHDLATAYHICENIVILYQGSIVEAGDVASVIMEPQHPYTQLLVRSIPWPDPERRWGEPEDVTKGQAMARGVAEGCKFAPRCPQAMDICKEKHPPLFRTSDTRAVACYLYDDAPAMQNSEINEVLAQTGRNFSEVTE